MLHELERFALKHDLPEPTAIQETDGQHVFLYSKNKDRRYAYSLTWTHGQSHILWVMLNPGTGETENRRRNTFERCKQWSRAMGYGGMIFGNVFSLRSKSAKDLLALGPRSRSYKRIRFNLSVSTRAGDHRCLGQPRCKVKSTKRTAWHTVQSKVLWLHKNWPAPAPTVCLGSDASCIVAKHFSAVGRGLTPRSSGAPTAGHQARAGGTRTFSPARAWRPAVGARLARTLGRTQHILFGVSCLAAHFR